jgi:hypothetical protein
MKANFRIIKTVQHQKQTLIFYKTKVSKQPRKVMINRGFFTIFRILKITGDY